MASKRQIFVGSVPIGGGAPVVVQTMTKTETSNLTATMDQIRKVADAGADVVRCAVPREQDAEALRTIVAESPIPVIADIHFNHTLALKAIEAGAHCDPPQPRQHRRSRQSRRGRRAGQPEKGADADRRQLGLAAETSARAGARSAGRGAGRRRDRVRRTDGGARLHQLQGLDQVDQRAVHDRRQPPALGEDPVSAPPRDHRGRDEMAGRAEIGGRAGDAARRRGRRHDPGQPLDLPRRGGGQGRLGDPQGAAGCASAARC